MGQFIAGLIVGGLLAFLITVKDGDGDGIAKWMWKGL